MRVSIVVPVYGVERYIRQCAVSLFSQTYTDIEYIFVDDCSPDGSIAALRSVMAEYPARSGQVRILRNDRNRGLGYTRARGVDAATGDCLMHVDSDDYVTPDAVEVLAECMERTGADIVDGAYRCVEENGLSDAVKAPHIEDRERYLRLMLCQDMVPAHVWARLIRRRLYTDYGINSTEGVDYAEDFSVMPRLMLHAHRAVTDSVVYCYRTDNRSSYTNSMTLRHVVSMALANSIVYSCFMNAAADSRLRAAAQVGLLNMLRNVRRSGFSLSEADRYCPHHAQSRVFRLVELLIRSRMPFFIADKAFRVLRAVVAR